MDESESGFPIVGGVSCKKGEQLQCVSGLVTKDQLYNKTQEYVRSARRLTTNLFHHLKQKHPVEESHKSCEESYTAIVSFKLKIFKDIFCHIFKITIMKEILY